MACGLGFLSAAATASGADSPTPRPNIWVTPADRADILQKIETQPWARAQFDALAERSKGRAAQHRADPDAYLRTLPWEKAEKGKHPLLSPITGDMASSGKAANQTAMQAMLAHAIDCGVLYYLTQDPALAAVGGDVLQAYVQALRGLAPSDQTANGGWLYPNDHLYEARILGAQLPILYDLVADHLRKPGATVWDLATNRRVTFDFAAAQEVFRTYARLAVEHGMQVSSNWPVLEMPSLAHNALALDDPAERSRWLAYVTHVDAKRQDPLEFIVKKLRDVGGVWPESFPYASDVAGKVTYIVALLERQRPALKLPADLGLVTRSLMRIREFSYPNGDLIRMGDGSGKSPLPMDELEIGYAMAVRNGNEQLAAEFGGLLKADIESGRYDRSELGDSPSGAKVYLAPVSLLWFEPEINVPSAVARAKPVTDVLPFAGIVLQRNLAEDADPAHGMMATVLGASYIHGHASGMSLELYGAGEVLITNGGKGTYRSELHQNYLRLFASYNGVIVNGSSISSGGWSDLGTDTVTPVVMEPAPGASPVSTRHSFTITRFTDKQLDGGKADQERTVGIVRTSGRGGYYVDLFRSRGAGSAQFHDYLLHHVADGIEWRNKDGLVGMAPAPDRFKPAPGLVVKKNAAYPFPGWHYFQDAAVSAESKGDFVADFFASKLGSGGLGTRVYFAGAPGREYASAMAPETIKHTEAYAKQPTPVAVVRQHGEAWTRPFAVIHQPYAGKNSAEGVRQVRSLESAGVWQGLVVDGATDAAPFRHFVIAPAPEQASVSNDEAGLRFAGRYAWVSVDARGDPTEIYVGNGIELKFRGVTLRRADGKAFSAKAEKTPEGWRITSPDSAGVTLSLDAGAP